jgi:hypothetical protein
MNVEAFMLLKIEEFRTNFVTRPEYLLWAYLLEMLLDDEWASTGILRISQTSAPRRSKWFTQRRRSRR